MNTTSSSIKRMGLVEDSTWKILFSKQKRIVTVAIIVLSTALAFFFSWMWIVNLPAIYFFYIFESKGKNYARELMKTFSKINNFTYEENLDKKTLEGALFKTALVRDIEHVVIGKYKDYPIRFFIYGLTGKTLKKRNLSGVEEYSVCEIDFGDIKFPHIVLKHHGIDRKELLLEKHQKINLDGELEDGFELYATMGYETEVLQIFTSELIDILHKKNRFSSIEFINNKIYIMTKGLRFSEYSRRLEELIDVLEVIIVAINPMLNSLRRDFRNLHQVYGEQA